jgi:uncharacterized repeat protein (TIGR01451 family)
MTIVRRRRARLVTLLTVIATCAWGVAAAAPASADFVCTTGTIYGLNQTGGGLAQVNTATGASSTIGIVNATAANGLGIPVGGGRYAFAVQNGGLNGGRVYRFDEQSGLTESFSGGPSAGYPMGGVNPANGYYYFAQATSSGLVVFAFDPSTASMIGQVARVTDVGSGNGDLAFDSLGTMYFALDTQLRRVNGVIPGTPGNVALSSTLLATLPAISNGIAFDGDGTLYIGSGSTYRQIEPATGQQIRMFTSFNATDLASCTVPHTIRAQVDLPNGRIVNSDQFTVTITGGGVTQGNSGTTQGTDSGVQDTPPETAGPVLGRTGVTYTVTETPASGADLANYDTTWRCVNTSGGDDQIAGGAGAEGEFTMPAGQGNDILCRFNNTPKPVSVALDKQAGTVIDDGNGRTNAGDLIPYTFTVTNTGELPLNPVTVNDPKVGAVSCPSGALTPGESIDCTATYAITQADMDAGAVANTATAIGRPPAGPNVTSDPDMTTTPLPSTPAIALDKQAGALIDIDGNGADAGDTITYRFLVTNTGTVTLNPVTVSDPKVGPVPCPAGPVAPSATVTCGPVTYTVTQADILSGAVNNIARATGTPPTGPPVDSPPDTTSTPTPARAAISLDKRAGAIADPDANGVDVGDTIEYMFVVTNTGNVPLDPVQVSDPKAGAVACPSGPLAPGADMTCTAAPYVLTQADVDRGSISNTATATGTPPTGPDVTDEDSTTTPTPAGPAIDLDKHAGNLTDVDGNGIASAGDTIAYTFLVTNTGNVTLNPVTISDPKVGPVGCPAGGLMPGATLTCGPVTYTVTQDDIAAGAVSNTATATGQPPVGPPVTNEDSTTTPLPPAPAIHLDKRAGTVTDVDGDGHASAGDRIAYRFAVTNTGNVPLDPVTVSDPKVGPVSCPPGALAPGATTQCGPATYALVQADINTGAVDNSATATGTPPSGPNVADDDQTSTPTPAVPAIRLDKTPGALVDANNNGFEDAGDTITYQFRVTNAGNVPLIGVTVDDPKVGPVTCPATPLAPGAFVDCSPVTYTVTAEDTTPPGPGIDPGVRNTATAAGQPPSGPPVEDDDTVFTPVPSAPAIRLDKRAGQVVDNDSNGVDAGDTISYTFVVGNAGNQPLDPVTVSDPDVGPVPCPDVTLGIGGTVICGPVQYTVTQADIIAGSVDNTATATGTPPGGPPVDSPPDSTSTPTPAAPAIALDKRAGTVDDTDDNGIVSAGDTILYSFVVANTGNVPLDPVLVRDSKIGTVTCPAAALAPHDDVTCTAAPYTLTQADVNSGAVENTATAIGTPPTGPDVTDDDDTTTPTPAAPSLRLDKQAGAVADLDDNGIDAGDTIDYTFQVRNTGNLPLDPVTVSDPKLGAVNCPAGPLAPNATVVCVPVTYAVTLADIIAGGVENTATATGQPPSGPPVTDADRVTTPTPAHPAIRLDKQAGALVDGDGNGPDAGDTIEYTFAVTNTGNVPLEPVAVSDPKVGAVTCPAGELAPADTVSCDPVTYQVTQADLDGGSVDNAATATGTPPSGAVVSDDDSASTPLAGAPAISLDKQAGALVDGDGNGPDVGDTIAYTFVVGNAGNVTLDPVAVSDPKAGPVSCPAGPLAPGESVTCGPVTYTLTQADLDARKVVNTATATGTPPAGPDVTTEDTVTTDTPPVVAPPPAGTPRVALDKRAGELVDTDDNGPDRGDTIEYAFVVANTGELRVAAIRVDDPKLSGVTCPKDALEPGESMTCTAPAYRITAGEAASGRVLNTATVHGRGVEGSTAEDPGEAVTTFRARAPKLRLSKRAGRRTARAGERVSFRIRVRNVGTGPARRVRVCDALPAGMTAVRSGGGRFRGGRLCLPRIARLAAGRSRTWRVTVRIDRDVTRRTRMVNRAVATAPGVATRRARAQVRVRPAPLPTEDRMVVTG